MLLTRDSSSGPERATMPASERGCLDELHKQVHRVVAGGGGDHVVQRDNAGVADAGARNSLMAICRPISESSASQKCRPAISVNELAASC
jgi:hypothetical protein